MGEGDHWSAWNQFRTAESQGSDSSFSFLYLGDGQNDLKSKWSRAIRQAYQKQPDARFIIHTGDLINRPNTDKEWGEWHDAAAFIHQMIPAVPTPGNHEYFRDAQRNLLLDPHWLAQFTLPDNGPQNSQAVFFTDYQNLRIVALNTQLILLDSVSRKAQLKWLEQVLKDNQQRWTIVMMHHPIHSTAKNRDNAELREQFMPLFERYKVDLVLQGHDHTYARGKGENKTGPTYVVSVSGPKMYESDSDRWMDVSLTNTQLYQTINISKHVLSYRSYKVDGSLFDSFELKK